MAHISPRGSTQSPVNVTQSVTASISLLHGVQAVAQ